MPPNLHRPERVNMSVCLKRECVEESQRYIVTAHPSGVRGRVPCQQGPEHRTGVAGTMDRAGRG